MTRYKIIETDNGYILETEWDVVDPIGTNKTVNVFAHSEDTDALESAFKYIRENR